MGFWDRNVENSFDRMFDMDRDGALNPVEQALQFDYFTSQIEDEDRSDDEDDD